MNSFNSEVGSRHGVLWPSFIEQFEHQGLLIEPVQTEVNLLDLAARSKELGEWVQCIRPQWHCLNNHEVRVFLIRGPDDDSIVWISWLGRRGSRWHITQHFPVDRSELSVSHQEAADELISSIPGQVGSCCRK